MKKFLAILMAGAVVLLPGCVNYMENGAALLKTGSYEEAIHIFEEAIAEGTDTGEAYRGIGIAQYELGAYDDALEAFENALKYGAEKTPTIYNLMGVCDMRREDYQSALNNFNIGMITAENAKEDYSAIVQEMKYNEIVCYEKLLDWENAKVKAEEYLALYPEDEKVQREAQFLRTR